MPDEKSKDEKRLFNPARRTSMEADGQRTFTISGLVAWKSIELPLLPAASRLTTARTVEAIGLWVEKRWEPSWRDSSALLNSCESRREVSRLEVMRGRRDARGRENG
jgi:hypothetical protein